MQRVCAKQNQVKTNLCTIMRVINLGCFNNEINKNGGQSVRSRVTVNQQDLAMYSPCRFLGRSCQITIVFYEIPWLMSCLWAHVFSWLIYTARQ